MNEHRYLFFMNICEIAQSLNIADKASHHASMEVS